MEILQIALFFWFGNIENKDFFPKDRANVWFSGGDEIDAEITEKFKIAIDEAYLGKFDHLGDDPRSLMAILLLLDQFPRNIYRNSPKFLEYDEKALKLCKDGLEKGLHKELSYIERVFFYLPLEHSEEFDDQIRCLKLFEELYEEVPESIKEPIGVSLNYAKEHFEVIKKFGRFPHRNKILGRESTDEEIKLLEAGGSFF
ncbi:hypothetical protein COB11_05560 [Candidatus Aerophobetes bacterium]|uniref:DUF924 domain-containing protein n=1 Tax=Aerophobetes bacterium TaxID=2030807 RepID=A0A2A4YF57_UNCAE|nr:MAG: hypothetical protein COB11_05560 [Candidatus Aerophobetes bacterium]